MARYRPKDFTREYLRLRDRVNREYGERAYNDRFKIESSGTLRQEEPDYSLHLKPYKQSQHNETPTSENTEKLETKEQPQKIEKSEALSQFPNQTQTQEQLDAYKPQLQSNENVNQLLEHPESAPVEDELLEDNQWDKFDTLGPNETFDDFISDEDIIRQEKLRKPQGQPRDDY